MLFSRSFSRAIITILVASPLFAYAPQFVLKTWTTEDGLPQNSVNAILQDDDGYLWLATYGGVVRFDGVRFSRIPALEEKMLSLRILSLAKGKDGRIWLGTEGSGITKFEKGTVTNYTLADGLNDDVVLSLFEDQRGILWIGTRQGINKFENGKIESISLHQKSVWVTGIRGDSKGRVWFTTTAGVYLQEGEKDITVVFPARGEAYTSLFFGEDSHGMLWFRTQRMIVGTEKIPLSTSPKVSFPIKRFYEGILFDKGGSYWLWTQNGGLFRAESDLLKDPFIEMSFSTDVSHYRIRCAYCDRDGNRWFGTDGHGLIRITNSLFTVLTSKDGLSHDIIEPVLEDSNGNLWVGTNCGGVNIIAPNGKITTLPQLLSECIWSLAEDRNGSIWIGTYGNGLYRYSRGQLIRYTTQNGLSNNVVVALKCTRDGILWIGTDGGGLCKYENGTFTHYSRENGLVNDNVRFIYEDSDGTLWIATLGGISKYTNGRFINYTTANGLTTNYVRTVFRDSKGTLWIGTYGGGLLRFQDEKFKAVTTCDGLFDNIVSAIEEDSLGYLWMTCNRGVFRIQRDELLDFCEGRCETVHSFVYGMEDGMLTSETNGGFQPSLCKTRDGRLCIPTIRGLAILPLSKVYAETPILPPVRIERCIVNRREYSTETPIEVPYDDQMVEIHYTALDLKNPRRVLFEYKLEGYNEKWIPALTQRAAFYSTLPHGSYQFIVRAFSATTQSGVSQPLFIRITPPFWERWEFLSACGVLAIVTAVGVVRRKRKRQKQQADERSALALRFLNSIEQERKKLATELHDSIGQDLLIIKNRALLGTQEKKKSGMVDQFHEISSSVTRAIERLREISYELRPYQIDRLGITKALESLVNRTFRGSGIKVTLNINLDDTKFPRAYGIHLYRIIEEIIRNIIKHAHATESTVTIFQSTSSLSIEVSDNGMGFDVESLSSIDIERRGLGLHTMRERVNVLKGTMTLTSGRENGTHITIRIPLQ